MKKSNSNKKAAGASKSENLKAVINALPKTEKPGVEDAKAKTKALAATTVMREIKYKYPKDIILDQVAKKKWRQKVRNAMRKFERDIAELKGQERKALEVKFKAYQASVLS